MTRKSLSPQLRFSVLSRDRFTCRYCARSAPDVELHVDHVVAVASGGTDDEANLVAACVECNLGKSASAIDGLPDAPRPRGKRGLHPLVGRGFLSFKDGRVREQGVVEAVFDNAGTPVALCQYFEWAMGEDTYQRLIPVAEMLFDDCGPRGRMSYRIFSGNAERNSYYQWKTDGSRSFEDGAR